MTIAYGWNGKRVNAATNKRERVEKGLRVVCNECGAKVNEPCNVRRNDGPFIHVERDHQNERMSV